MTLVITALYIYPVKSMAPVPVESLSFDPHGVEGDRQYMVVNQDGRFLTQRQCPAMARIQPVCLEQGLLLAGADGSRCEVSPEASARRTVQVWKDEVDAADCGDAVADWLTRQLGRPCRLVCFDDQSQRPVDPDFAQPGDEVRFSDGFPVLMTHQASLMDLEMDLGRAIDMVRFRPNLVVSGGVAFDELNWSALQCDDGVLELVKPCERCVIPTRDLKTLQREDDVLDLLKRRCLHEGRITFGQNAIARGLDGLVLGQSLQAVTRG